MIMATCKDEQGRIVSPLAKSLARGLVIMRRILTSALFLCFVSCSRLPTDQQVARKYAAEDRDRTVVQVTSNTSGVAWRMKAEFRVTYTEDGSPRKTDVVRYHLVAKGWVTDL